MSRLPLACLFALLLALPAFADDGPETTEKKPPAKPVETGEPVGVPFATASASWPAPSKERAFTVELVAVVNGNAMGTYLVEVGPAIVEEKVVGWRVHERLALDAGGRELAGDTVYTFTPDFRPIEGRSAENFGGKPETDTWTVADGKITLTHTVEGSEPETKTIDAAAFFPGKAGMFMAARFMAAEAATITGQDFSGTDEDSPLTPFRLVVDPDFRHESLPVLAFDGHRGKKRIRLLVDPKSRAIVRGMLTEEGSPMRLELVPAADAPQKDDIFAREPRTAEEGSAHALYAITVKDKALIEKAFRWSTMYEATKKQLVAAQQEVPSFEDFRKQAIQNFAAGAPDTGTSPGQVRAGLQMFLKQLQVQDTPQGWKAVIWPPQFGRLLVVMEKKDDGWKAIGLRKLGN